MKDSVKAVRFVTMKGDVRDLPAASIRFDYRRAYLPKGVVVGVWLQLRHGIRAEIARIVKDYLHYRKDTQPLAMPSAGCVFKNPPQDSAGRLLEATGLKGLRVGDAEVSTKHGNFIVNRGHASAADVIGLDVCLAILEVLHRDLGDDKYRPAPLLRQMVAAGRLGRKSGRGFYAYRD